MLDHDAGNVTGYARVGAVRAHAGIRAAQELRGDVCVVRAPVIAIMAGRTPGVARGDRCLDPVRGAARVTERARVGLVAVVVLGQERGDVTRLAGVGGGTSRVVRSHRRVVVRHGGICAGVGVAVGAVRHLIDADLVIGGVEVRRLIEAADGPVVAVARIAVAHVVIVRIRGVAGLAWGETRVRHARLRQNVEAPREVRRAVRVRGLDVHGVRGVVVERRLERGGNHARRGIVRRRNSDPIHDDDGSDACPAGRDTGADNGSVSGDGARGSRTRRIESGRRANPEAPGRAVADASPVHLGDLDGVQTASEVEARRVGDRRARVVGGTVGVAQIGDLGSVASAVQLQPRRAVVARTGLVEHLHADRRPNRRRAASGDGHRVGPRRRGGGMGDGADAERCDHHPNHDRQLDRDEAWQVAFGRSCSTPIVSRSRRLEPSATLQVQTYTIYMCRVGVCRVLQVPPDERCPHADGRSRWGAAE